MPLTGAKNYLIAPEAGLYSSSIYDAGQAVQWSRISWAETLPTNTDVQFQVAVASSLSGPWTYRGPDGTSATYFTTPAGENLPNTSAFNGRYCRFQARLTSTDGLNTPSFGDVHLSFGATGMLASESRVYDFDAAGNITKVSTTTNSGTTVDDRNPVANPINNLNQIKQRIAGGATWTYSYDLNGNMTGKTDGTNTWTYTWNDENRLTRVQGPGGVDVVYSYDFIGRMLTRVSGGATTRFVWDGWDCVREVTGSSETVYHIPDGMLHSFNRDGATFQVWADALGSVRMVTDASGAVVMRREMDAWGNALAGAFDNVPGGMPYGFIGARGCRTDAATGMVYMRNRWYDASGLQRFISRDPIGLRGGSHAYAYVGNSPVNFVDPSGLVPNGLVVNDPTVTATQTTYPGGFNGQSHREHFSNFVHGILRVGSIFNAGFAAADLAFGAAMGEIDPFAPGDPENAVPFVLGGGGGFGCPPRKPTMKVQDLKGRIIHSETALGKRPDLGGLSDRELLQSVNNPRRGDYLQVNTRTGGLSDGNSRARELLNRASSSASNITGATPIRYEPYTPGSVEW